MLNNFCVVFELKKEIIEFIYGFYIGKVCAILTRSIYSVITIETTKIHIRQRELRLKISLNIVFDASQLVDNIFACV